MCAPDTTNAKGASNNKNSNTPSQVSTTTAAAAQQGDALTKKMSTTSSTSSSSRYIRRRHSMAEASSHMTAGTVLSLFFVVLAAYLPFFLSPSASKATFHHAGFDYHADISHFDNSIWTYGTDYGLAVAMGLLIYSFPFPKESRVLTFRAQGMLFCYLLSVLAGGIAHQFYLTAEERQHWSFRFLWTVCVGTVTLAPAFMGSIGTELDHLDRESYDDHSDNTTATAFVLPSIPAWFWAAYATFSTIVVMTGGFSYQRPACDIFMAGVTQTPSTFYVMVVLGLGMKRFQSLTSNARLQAAIGFILNAPLFPLYPLLVQYTNLSLGAINTLLHTWLFVAWTTQGLSLRNAAIVLDEYYHPKKVATAGYNKNVDEKKED